MYISMYQYFVFILNMSNILFQGNKTFMLNVNLTSFLILILFIYLFLLLLFFLFVCMYVCIPVVTNISPWI